MFLCVSYLYSEKWRLPVVQSSIMIPQDLLDLLVCPACKKDLEVKTDPEALKCTACKRVYPVRDGLPVLLIEEATIDPS